MGMVGSDDRVGVIGAVLVDMRDGFVDTLDDPDGEDRREIFGAPVLLGRFLAVDAARLEQAARGRIAAQLYRLAAVDAAQLGQDARRG